ncbi:MAG TPA: PrsW family glutamic-type intramembrane protease [Candidatus Paceibacterota bacterium]
MDILASAPFGTLGYAFLGGVLPPLVWLYFLLKEDDRCPEPLPCLLIAFISGMLAVPFALLLETLLRDYAYIAYAGCSEYAPLCVPIILGWSVIEETLKYVLVALLVLWRADVNEPIDLVIYMLTAALGFAALENVLFLIVPFANGDVLMGLQTGNLRFIGSTLLHVMASSAVGFALAFSLNFLKPLRAFFAIAGLILAIALHALFNFFIIQGDGVYTLFAFLIVWTAAVAFFALFETLRYVRYRNLPKNVC